MRDNSSLQKNTPAYTGQFCIYRGIFYESGCHFFCKTQNDMLPSRQTSEIIKTCYLGADALQDNRGNRKPEDTFTEIVRWKDFGKS